MTGGKPRKHHFVPRHVLVTFACPDAWRLVRPNKRDCVRDLDEHALADRARSRSWPLAVLELQDGTPVRLKRGTVESVMQKDHLYGIRDYRDATDRAIANWLLRTWTGETDLEPVGTFEELLALGDGVHLPSLIEETVMAPLDGAWAKLLQKVRSGARLSSPELKDLRRGLQVSQMRSPSWQTWVAKDARRVLAGTIGRAFGVGPHSARTVRDLGGGISNRRIGEVMLENDWVLLVASFARGKTSIFAEKKLRLELCHAHRDVPFILPDSPLRPFVPTHPKDVRERNLGFENGRTVGVYPLSPRLALVASARPELPSHRILRRHLSVVESQQLNTGMLLGSDRQVVVPTLQVEGLFLPRTPPDLVGIPGPRM